MRFSTFFFITFLIYTVNSAKILGIFHMAAYSHYRLSDVLLKELAKRGHEITIITPYPEKTQVKNVKEILLTGFQEDHEERKMNLFDVINLGAVVKIIHLEQMGLEITENVFNHTNVQKLLRSDEHFDMVIMEQFLNEGMRGFCYHYKAHCVVLSTIGTSRWINPQMGNPGPPSYVPDVYMSYSTNMNFYERICNSLVYVIGELYQHLYTLPQHNKIMHKYISGAPHLYDIYYNTSLMLVNSHVSTNPALPLLPNMIDIGGYHVSAAKPLPKEIQEYLDSAKDGAIFFSMGSNLKSTDMSEEKRDSILTALSKLKQKVLWKWEKDILPGQPPNVKLGKWLPQQDILAHPNIKAFITHGGLLSTIETIHHGVPVVGIPVFGDQEINIAHAENAGYGIGVSYRNLDEASLTKALNEILNNPKYMENAKRRSRIMYDQPIKPLDKAMFWIEYVLRHNGAPHLRTSALNLTWYQYLLLDVVVVVGIICVTVLVIFCLLVKMLFCSKKDLKTIDPRKRKSD